MRLEVFQIALHHRLQISIHHDRAGALVFAKFGKNLMRDRKRHAELLAERGRRHFVLRVGERKQQRDRNRLRMFLAESCFTETASLRRRRLQDLAVAGGALVHAKAQIGRHQRFHAIKEEIVKLGPGLAADLDGIFETSGGDQRHARAFALQQVFVPTVVPCRRTVEIALADFLQRFDNGLRGSSGVEKTLSMRTCPRSTQTQSVNVPPVSMAMWSG